MSELKNLFIEGTNKTPGIDFNQTTGEFLLTGKSIPENSAKIYEPLLDWIETYLKSPQQTTNLRIRLEYFNSATLIWLAKIIKVLSTIDTENSNLFIHLYFSEEDYDDMDTDEIRDIVGSLIKNTQNFSVRTGIKIHCVDNIGRIIKGSTVIFSADGKLKYVPFYL
jgi:hypothetical protein